MGYEELVEYVRCVCVWRGEAWVESGFGSGRRGWRAGEWMRGASLGFTNPLGTEGVLDVCLCFGCGGVGGVGMEWVGVWTRVWTGWCYVCVSCGSGFSM